MKNNKKQPTKLEKLIDAELEKARKKKKLEDLAKNKPEKVNKPKSVKQPKAKKVSVKSSVNRSKTRTTPASNNTSFSNSEVKKIINKFKRRPVGSKTYKQRLIEDYHRNRMGWDINKIRNIGEQNVGEFKIFSRTSNELSKDYKTLKGAFDLAGIKVDKQTLKTFTAWATADAKDAAGFLSLFKGGFNPVAILANLAKLLVKKVVKDYAKKLIERIMENRGRGSDYVREGITEFIQSSSQFKYIKNFINNVGIDSLNNQSILDKNENMRNFVSELKAKYKLSTRQVMQYVKMALI